MEHFWRGLSHPKDQVSAIPPEGYGERFFNFISGIVKSPEEAARDKEAKCTQAETETTENGSTMTRDIQPPQTATEGEGPATATAPGPLTERTGTLPVVEEAGEGSTSGRSRNGSTRSVAGSVPPSPGYMDGAPMVKNDSGLGQHAPSPHGSFEAKIVGGEDMAISVTRVVRS